MSKKPTKESSFEHLSEENLDDYLASINLSYDESIQRGIRQKVVSKMGDKKRFSMKKRKNYYALAILGVLVIPTGVFAAVKGWNYVMNQNGYETSFGLFNNEKENTQDFYQVKVGYLPENVTPMAHEVGKFQNAVTHKEGLSFALIKIDKKEADLKADFVTNYQEKKTKDNKVYWLLHRQKGYDLAYIPMEKEGHIVQLYVENKDLSKEELEKIISGISLEKVKERPENVMMYSDLVDRQNEAEEEKPETLVKKEEVKDLGKETSLKLTHQEVPLKIDQMKVTEMTSMADFINKPESEVTVFAAIKFLKENAAVDTNGNLKAFQADVYKRGDGINSLDEKVDTVKVSPKVVKVSMRVTNTSKTDLKSFSFNPTLHILNESKAGYELDTTSYIVGENKKEHGAIGGSQSYEPAYIPQHGEGKSYYFVGEIPAGKTKEIQVYYVVAQNKKQAMLLEFNLNGEDRSNTDNVKWLKLK